MDADRVGLGYEAESSLTRFATPQQVLESIRGMTGDLGEQAVLLDSQMLAFETWKENPKCWQRSILSAHDGSLLGTICACPTSKHVHGVGCTKAREECPIARAYDRSLQGDKRRLRSKPVVQAASGSEPNGKMKSLPTLVSMTHLTEREEAAA